MVEIEPIKRKLHLDVLTADQLVEIKSTTLQVLECIGVRFPSERAIKVFAEHGANVDFESQIVRLPPDMVLEAMSHAPRHYVMGSRSEAMDCTSTGSTATLARTAAEHKPSVSKPVSSASRVKKMLPRWHAWLIISHRLPSSGRWSARRTTES